MTGHKWKNPVTLAAQVSNNLLAMSIIPYATLPGKRRRRRRWIIPSTTIAEQELKKESKLLSLTACIVNKGVNILNDNLNLTPSDLAVLSCGFSFIPPPNHKRKWSNDLMNDYASFVRNIRIKHFFKNDISIGAPNAEKLLHMFVNKQRLLKEPDSLSLSLRHGCYIITC